MGDKVEGVIVGEGGRWIAVKPKGEDWVVSPRHVEDLQTRREGKDRPAVVVSKPKDR